MLETDFSGFIVAHLNYFGFEPIVRKMGSSAVKISTCRYSIPNTCIPQIQEFYNFRIHRGLRSHDKLDSTDFTYLQTRLESKTYLRLAVAVCMQVSYDRFGNELKHHSYLSLEEIYYKLGKTSIVNKSEFSIEWNGETKTMHEWAACLEMTTTAFRRRYKEYGVCELLFMSREDFKKNSAAYKKMKNFDPEMVGNEEWRALSPSMPALRLERFNIPVNNATALITAMVQDAVDNVEKRDKRYSDESVKFLTNSNGYLKWLLDAFPGCSASYLINELQNRYNRYLRIPCTLR